MPIYEYKCVKHGKFEKLCPLSEASKTALCPNCQEESPRVISLVHWSIGWNFLKDKSEKSPPAPEDAGFYPEWDQAYAPYRGGDTIKV